MSISPRSALLGLLLLVPLAACGSEDDGGAIVPAETTATSEGDSGSSTTAAPTTATTTAPEPTGTVIDVVVAGGQPEGGSQSVDVPVGEQVTLRVTADAADEVHVHGYDLFADTVPGEAVELTFVAEIPGQFEIELEDSHVLLVELTVS